VLLRIDLMFVGTRYRGWQAQARGATVQGALEKALKSVGHSGKRPVGCSRTDSGVHARTYAAHFETDLERDLEAWLRGLNGGLPEDVRVYRVSRPVGEFHARYSCASKTYRYHIYTGPVVPPAVAPFVWQWRGRLDRSSLGTASDLFSGEHDFAAFTTGEGRKRNTVRDLRACRWEERGNILVLVVEGRSFLHRMVRCVGGALIAHGTGRVTLDDIRAALGGRGGGPLLPALPARGLVLWDIEYPSERTVETLGTLPPEPLLPL